MKNKYTVIFFVIVVFFVQNTFAQNRRGLIGGSYNVGSLVFAAGPAYLFGDLGGSMKENPTVFDNINLDNVRFEVSLGFRHSFSNRLGYRVSLHHGLYESTDEGLRNDHRGYASTSNISMFTAWGEFNILQFYDAAYPWRMYVYGGGGFAYASIDLRGSPVTGNARSKTSEFTPIIPFGLGLDVWTSPNFNVGLEVGWKYALSDYMDGIEIIGTQNDILWNASLTLSYRIFGKKMRESSNCGCW
jgi:hypothetical protein